MSQLLCEFQQFVYRIKQQLASFLLQSLSKDLYGFRPLVGSRAISRASYQRCGKTPRRQLVMDYMFDCFYNDTFSRITRNGLQDRQSRRDVLDHLGSLVKGCSKGQNVHTEKVACVAVIAALRYHRLAKEGNGKVCLMGKYHNILYIALRTCWDWGVRDSAVVVQLLVAIYECEKTFERIFLGALFGPHAPHFIAGWRSDFQDQHENIRAMVYFLKHATRQNLTFPVWIPRFEHNLQLRFIDVPVESCGRSSPLRIALQANAPHLLLLLLRYGAAPNPPDGGTSVIMALLDKLIEYGREYNNELVMCLRILLRNIPMIDMPFKPIIFSTRRKMFFERYGHLLMDNVIGKEQVYGVPSLRHISRCCIRDVLRAQNQLPMGIESLCLPRRLQRYIDLTEELERNELQLPIENLTETMQRLETVSDESDDESENRVQLLEVVTEAEKAAVNAFAAAGDGATTNEAQEAAAAAYAAANEASKEKDSSAPGPRS